MEMSRCRMPYAVCDAQHTMFTKNHCKDGYHFIHHVIGQHFNGVHFGLAFSLKTNE